MLTAGDALAKTLAKSQKVTFWSQKNGFGCFFFWLTAGDALSTLIHYSFSHQCVSKGFRLSSATADDTKKEGGRKMAVFEKWEVKGIRF